MENALAEASHKTDLSKEAANLRVTEREIELLDAKHMAQMKQIGAFSDIEIRDRQERMELELARIAQEQAASSLSSLQAIEQRGKDQEADRDIRKDQATAQNEIAKARAEADARVAQLQAGAKMTPEQILAINAGLSPDVADVLKEQARAKAGDGGDVMGAMKELIKGAAQERASERAHVLDILKAGMTGAAGVARGAGGKDGGGDGGDPDDPDATVECPKCGRTNSAKAKFCTGCGHRLRT